MRLSCKPLLAALLGAAIVTSQCVPPQSNSATVDLIGEFEGWRPDICKSPMYAKLVPPIGADHFPPALDLDPTGNPTVGYGHLCADSSCSDVKYPIPLSVANGKLLLREDMAVSRMIPAECSKPTEFATNKPFSSRLLRIASPCKLRNL